MVNGNFQSDVGREFSNYCAHTLRQVAVKMGKTTKELLRLLRGLYVLKMCHQISIIDYFCTYVGTVYLKKKIIKMSFTINCNWVPIIHGF